MVSAFTLEIDTENAAFEDDPAPELARILRKIADDIEHGDAWKLTIQTGIYDVNGNRVGHFATALTA